MIDIKDLRADPEKYKANMQKKGRNVQLIEVALSADEVWRKAKYAVDAKRKERNEVSEAINKAKKAKDEKKAKELIGKAKKIPDELKKLEAKEAEAWAKVEAALRKLPNLMHEAVPEGRDDSDNVELKTWGKKPSFGFTVKNHVELAEKLGVVDFDASAKVAGSGFYYLKGDLALLNRALVHFTIDFMAKQGYTYIEPPLMVSRAVASAAGDLEAFSSALYKIHEADEDAIDESKNEGREQYLIPTSEHAILGMMSDQTVLEKDLPLKYFGYSMCFRKEIGSHGINEKGLWRTHQFNKVEQFIFCKPDDSWKLYDELLGNTEKLMQALKLPYRVIEICTGDLGDWKARSADVEVWRPTTEDYGEVASLSNCTDYQARDLNIRGVDKHGERYVLHTLNNTAIATSRIMVAILENYQQKDGSVKIPTALVPYMLGKKVLKS